MTLLANDQTEECKFIGTCSIVELPQEQFSDLFPPNKRDKAPEDIRETLKPIVMLGLIELEVNSAREVADHPTCGSAGRPVPATAMSETLSRSHAILTLTVVSCNLTGSRSRPPVDRNTFRIPVVTDLPTIVYQGHHPFSLPVLRASVRSMTAIHSRRLTG
ncbi:GL19532 [Drosophila persimilis]|uniref:GL19532 n=1 Tax=Drosophila persimilis TaxID=7234 RepID=B4G9S1_DROPE|nr:GL19532 [Drosophila persimilis]